MTREIIAITGINGFVGEHLARHLKEYDYAVTGIGREQAPNDKVAHLVDDYHSCDLLDKEAVRKLDVKNAAAIIHLAGLASVGDSFKNPDLFIEGNATMTDNLLSLALDQGFKGRVVAISTGAVYNSDQPSPFSETAIIGGSSPYATGKIKAEQVAHDYMKRGLSVVVARPFNHIGPGQNQGFLLPDMYAQLIAAKHVGETSITTGDLTTRRDYTDVRDIVRAYSLLALAGSLQFDTYNVASGSSRSGEEILNLLEKSTGIEEISHVTDPARLRTNDPKDITGDASRITSELGWRPEIDLETTIKDFVASRQ